MNTFNSRIDYLWQQFIDRQASQAELDELMELLATGNHDEQSLQHLSGLIAKTPAAGEDRERWAPILQSILEPVVTPLERPVTSSEVSGASQRSSVVRTLVRRSLSAAAALLFIGGLYYLWHRAPIQQSVTMTPVVDVKPGGNKATLTLAGGQKIVLDSAASGLLVVQGNTEVQKPANGQLSYLEHGSSGVSGDAPSLYNTLTTPRGGQYQLTLPDGTKVWLNAASSITYPTTFKGSSREVMMTGEAYFEVVHDEKRPFRVRAGDQLIQDIGTKFNVDVYTDEPAQITTLLEGAVKINGSLLRPGQRASLASNTGMVVEQGDVVQAVAWKNGLFDFSGASLETVMREIGRWYDVDIRYEGAVPQRQFTGMIGRSLTLSQVLHGLAEQRVHYRIEEGNHLIITP